MPTDLERQLARFAEALDREAPAISVDDIVGRGTVAVDVDALEPPVSDRASRVDGFPWVDTTPSAGKTGERDVLIELAPAVVVQGPAWRRVTLKVVLAAAAVALLVVTLTSIERGSDDELDPIDVPPSTAPTPLPKSFTSPDGEVTISTPDAWDEHWGGAAPSADGTTYVWFGMLWRGPEKMFEEPEFLGLVDPVAYDEWCEENGGSPLLSEPANADAIVRELRANPNFETTAPVAANVGGIEAVSVDVALAPGGKTCGVGIFIISRWIHDLAEGEEPFETPRPSRRLRLYLVDLPEGMSVRTLAITVVAPEERFEQFIEETAPIIESIDFHPNP